MTKSSKVPLLGEFQFAQKKFSQVEEVFSHFEKKEFERNHSHAKSNLLSKALLKLIQKEKGPCFLLDAVVDFISRVREKNLVEGYTLSSFELYLNQFSGLSQEENQEVRSKIIGKALPRDAYQIYFPIGMGKSYPGSHFVTAHHSPDLDTTTASFWGWVDAFGARVGEGLHIWNLPGGPSYTQVEIALLFQGLLGEKMFDILSKTRLSLTLTSLDLLTQSGISRKHLHELALNFDFERHRSAVILVDAEGFYLGDWRNIDVEGVRQIVMALNNCLMWLESNFHMKLISCFAKKELSVQEISLTIREILDAKISDSHPAKEFTTLQSRYVGKYLSKVLQVKSGLDAKFEEFARVMESIKVFNFTEITIWLKSLIQSELFDQSGKITESRPLIFNTLETLVVKLSEGFASIRKYVDRLDIALKIKTDVFGFAPQYLTHRTDIEEIRSKMDSYSYLTVNHTEIDGKKVPIGVVHASEIQKEVLATVSLRDFCNREEMAIPSYIEVISVIDHHKSLLATKAPPTAFISDAQSTCTLLAEMACELNDKYSLSGMNWEEITSQLKELEKGLDSVPNIRLYQRLLQKKKLLSFPSSYFIDSRREYLEYLHFLYAILDDTDLLTKVTKRDVECAFSLLNRLKTLTLKKEVEVINFDQIKEEKEFTSLAAKALLQNEDFYSLYSKVYLFKEQSVEENLEQCAKRHSSNIFGDMKIMGGSSRVGQTKLFCSNIPLFSTLSPKLRRIWLEQSQKIYESSKEILLHLHMISTVASAGELFRGEEIEHFHLDEIWIWIPPKEIAEEYLKIFLSGLKTAPYIRDLKFSVQFLGENAEQLSLIFKESFFPISHEMKKEQKLSIAVLRFNAGKINSRKAMIVPYLPGGTKYT